ncbi:glutathione S-transferase family protein [Falsiroseomonas sp. HC035]|uniref:glutathione S-transferase family protein n=1 Tax=Falsiroseomonas sp. HC035 TaxID=3390999 RepID=UPI003D320943
MSTPILWTSTFSSGSIAHQVAMVSGVPFEARFVSIRAGDTRRPDYLAMNPKGEVPALQLPDGTVITEIPAILCWFAEAAPEAGLLPRDATGRAKGLEWLAWCHWTMGRSFSAAFNPRILAGDDQAAQQAVRAHATGGAAQALAFADAAVAKAGGTLLGTAQPTAPDIFLAALVAFGGFLKLDAVALTNLAALQARVAAMPGVAAATAAEQARG